MYCVLGHTEPSVSALDQGAENGTSFSVVVVVVRRESASLTVSGVRSKSKTPLHVLQICSLIPLAIRSNSFSPHSGVRFFVVYSCLFHRSLVVARRRRDDILSYPDNGHGALFLPCPAKLARTGNRLQTGALSILTYEPLHVSVEQPGLITSNHTIVCREVIMSAHIRGIYNISYDT